MLFIFLNQNHHDFYDYHFNTIHFKLSILSATILNNKYFLNPKIFKHQTSNSLYILIQASKYITKLISSSKLFSGAECESIITIHGFRHSHASLLINLGLDFKEVAERLGDTVEMVQNTYYHMFPEKKSNTVNALNKLNGK